MESTDPHGELAQETDQLNVCGAPDGVAEATNCCVPLSATVAVFGATATAIFTICTLALADLVESAAEVAVTVTVAGLGGVAGAVYNPLVEMLPQAAPLQPDPATDHVTAVLLVLVTVAVNCWVRLTPTVTVLLGEIFTLTAPPPGLFPPLLQPARKPKVSSKMMLHNLCINFSSGIVDFVLIEN